MHSITKSEKWGNPWLVDARNAQDFLLLPSGDYIRPVNIQAVRVTPAKADPRTGEVAAAIHISHHDSWFTVKFEALDQAQAYAAALMVLNEAARTPSKRVDKGDVGRMMEEADLVLNRPPEGEDNPDDAEALHDLDFPASHTPVVNTKATPHDR